MFFIIMFLYIAAYTRTWYTYRCLAHIINLATQALIETQSKAQYFDPHNINDHTPDINAVERDELGLIRAISVKVSILTIFVVRP